MANVAVKNASGGTVYLSSSGAGTDVDPHIPAHTISGTVAVSSIPAVSGTVAISGNPAVAGTVAVSSLPGVAGTVSITGTPNVAVTSLPGVAGTVAVSSIPDVAGTVVVSSQPAVSGTVAISGTIPTTDAGYYQSVTHTNMSTSDASGTVAISGTPSSGQKIVLTDIIISCKSALDLTLQEATSATVVLGPWHFAANGVGQFTTRGRLLKLPVADRQLMLVASAAGTVSVDTWWFSEA